MDRADFMHLLRLSEQASAQNSRAYRRSVALFAALGYVWVLGSLLLALGLLGWIGWRLHNGARLHGGFFVLGFMALGLLWASLSALWLRRDAPEGHLLQAQDAPALFALLDKIRRKTKGPPIHQVFLNRYFNASIQQHPRFGLLGGSVNCLHIGLPLLMALDVPRLAAVLAHEYGHLRGGHGRFMAWIYRTRMAWERLFEHTQRTESLFGWLTLQFLRWYAPRFSARTFAMARQDEYEADRSAARIVGPQVMAAALADIALKSVWLAEHFWPDHWQQAHQHAQPLPPFQALRTLLAAPLEADFARRTFRQELKRLPEVDDTHPGLRERLQALGQPLQEPAPATGPSALGLLARRQQWVSRFDRDWQHAKRSDWQRAHASAQRVQRRLEALQSEGAHASADALLEQAHLLRRLDSRAPITDLLERALRQSPGHGDALQALIASLPPDDPRRLPLLEQLHESSPSHRWWAADRALGVLEADTAQADWDEAALKRWRQRLKTAARTEEQVQQELHTPPYLARTSAHGLSAFDLDNLQHQLSAFADCIHTAWLVRKQLQSLPERPAWLLLVHAPDLDMADSWHLRLKLDQSLCLPGSLAILLTDEDLRCDDIRLLHRVPVFGLGAAQAQV